MRRLRPKQGVPLRAGRVTETLKVTETLLYELFVQAGPVERVTLPLGDGAPPAHKGFCFVQVVPPLPPSLSFPLPSPLL